MPPLSLMSVIIKECWFDLCPQHEQLYTWAAVNQPPHSLDLWDLRTPGQMKGPGPMTRPGSDTRTGLKPTEDSLVCEEDGQTGQTWTLVTGQMFLPLVEGRFHMV